MNNDDRRTKPGIGILATALLCCWAGVTLGEVGVIVEFGSTAVNPYAMRRIIEDTDPVGSSWQQFGPSAANRAVLNTTGETNGDGVPSVLLNPVSGLPIVAWARNGAAGFDVVVSRFEAGAWSVPAVVAQNVTAVQDPLPRLVLSPADGSVHLLYWENEAAPRVLHRQAPADLSSWGPPVQVSQVGELAKRPAGVFHEGLLHAVYESHSPSGQGGTPRYLVLAVQDGNGFSYELVGTTSYTAPNLAEVHSTPGTLWVEWIDDEGEMAWTRKQGAGNWDPVLVEPFAGIEQRDFHVRGTIRRQAVD